LKTVLTGRLQFIYFENEDLALTIRLWRPRSCHIWGFAVPLDTPYRSKTQKPSYLDEIPEADSNERYGTHSHPQSPSFAHVPGRM
jgi:hypothetical protein